MYISATATDGDGDTAHAVSPAGLHINFQDDGPHAFAEAPQDVLEGSAPVTGQLDFDPGADGATVTEINGVNLSFGVDGYSQAIALAHGSLQVTADGAYKFVAQPDDVYKTGGPANFTYTVTDGDGDTSASTVSFVVTDDSDPTKVTLNDVTVNEGVGTATISASVDHAPQGSNLVLTLSNGATITILNGQTTGTSTPFAVQGDDPYVDHETYPVSVTGATGGNYELLDTTDTSTVTVNDTITTNFVTLDNVVVFENQTFVYTAHMDYASLTPFTVTLNNGVNITFAPGQFTAMSAPQAAQGEDVYVDGQVIPVSIAGTSGGNFEAVNTTTYGNATVTFKDTIDPTKVTLNDVTVNEGVGTATISASVDHAPQGSNLVLTLSNGATITILNGQTTGTSTPFAVQGDDPYVDHETYPVSVTGATGGNYELLDTTDTATVTVNDTITTNFVTLDNVVVFENQTFVYTAHMDYASLTPFTVTLNNGVDITFAAGSFTAMSAPQAAQGEDVYVDGQVIPVSIAGTSGGNFEAVNTTTYGNATVTFKDTIDDTTVSLTATPSITEADTSITYTATLSHPAQAGQPVTVTLSTGDVITIAGGASSGSVVHTVVPNEDVYLDPTSVSATISTASGGNFEHLVVNSTPAVTQITDTIDDTTVSLTATPSITEADTSITYTATLSHPAQAGQPVTVTLSTGDVITIAGGASSGSVVHTVVPNEDVYLDPTSVSATISTASGGNFEHLVVNSTPAVTQITDTIDDTTVSLAATPSITEADTSITYTATLSHPAQAGQPVTVTLSTGDVITIAGGASSGSVVHTVVPNEDVYLDPTSVSATISTASGGNFEHLVVNSTPAVTQITDTIDDTTVSLAATPSITEADTSITYTATLSHPAQAGQPVTVTLSTGDVITIAGGASSGSVVHTVVPNEDVYLDPTSVSATISTASGGNFEHLVVNSTPAVTQITDTIDDTTVSLTATPSITEADTSITYTATLSHPAQAGQPVTVTLSTGDVITIAGGASSGSVVHTVVPNEDVYLDPTSVSATISTASGGNFEHLVVNSTPAVTQITDTIDDTTVSLAATPSITEADTSITYTATLSHPAQAGQPVTVTLSTGDVITIAGGASSGSVVHTVVPNEDVYLDPTSVSATISTASGGNFEHLVVNSTPAVTQITDTINPVTATLTTSTTTISEYGGSITYTVTLSSGLSPFTPKSPLDVLLSNGEHVIIAANASSGSVTRAYTDAEITSQVSIVDSINSVSNGAQYEQLLTTGSTIVPVVYSPTIAVGPNNGLPEDTQEGIQFTATVGGSSHVTQIVVSGLTGWNVDATAANIALTGGGGTASVNSASFNSGVLTINITGAADGAAVTAAVLMSPPLNSDVDATVSMTATAAQGATTSTSAATPGTIYVDAVADAPAPVTGQSHIIFVKDSASDTNSAFSNGETGSLQVKATLGDVHDGSETHVLDIHLQTGFTAALAASGTIAGTYNGVGTNFSYTYSSGTGDIHIIVPNDTALNQNTGQTATIDLSFAVTAPLTGTLPDNLNFSITATSTEATLSGGGVGAANADLTTDNVATFLDSTAIPAARLLSGAFKTNTNSNVQEAILSFVDEAQPLDAFAQLMTFQGTGQASTFAGDAGFNITGSHTFEVVLEAAFTATSQVNVTDFTLNNVTMDKGGSGVTTKIEYLLSGSTAEALTSEIVPDGAHNADTYVNSQDGSSAGNNPLTGTSVNGNYVYGFSGDDTLVGGTGNTFLNGGAGADVITGGSKNDVIVFDTNDTSVNGGAGFDILRIDEGAIYNSSFQVSGAPTGGLSAANSHVTGGVRLYDVDLSTENLTNLEAIQLTAEASASSLFGTELHGLTASNVVAFTGGAGAINSQTGTANTLFVIGSAGDDVELTGFSETAATYTSAGGQVFHQWVSTSGPAATLFIDNDLQVNHAAQA
ncbi:uncharacterized protein YqfB (UPF0267 family) [Bradyrhizobium diazoefficiens]